MTSRWLTPVFRSGFLLLCGLWLGTGGDLVPLALAQEPPLARVLLQPGDRGPEVGQLQRQLAELGFYAGEIDAIFGEDTAAAVRSLQQQQTIPVDGLMGAQTWLALAAAQAAARPTLPFPLIAQTVSFTPLIVAQPAPPPSALWLGLMPLVPITGGLLTYLKQRLQRRLSPTQLSKTPKFSEPPKPPKPPPCR
ncbi:peptidoglycan-binding domain-containing protein [Nodosilinea sp. E11]|uniref:peptidoglycan-binding domain-containing protein n=1 Tax=Nodosilinea sp. E11 TaxID=3037479 RepID=UPI002934E1EE|nr:peptidoglycan-binding domain-containing protein [Nodosilinea sp. E11]WOD40581.1 peptidoglycan-binding domain-containing protein [Nodosilinea sp. E11]